MYRSSRKLGKFNEHVCRKREKFRRDNGRPVPWRALTQIILSAPLWFSCHCLLASSHLLLFSTASRSRDIGTAVQYGRKSMNIQLLACPYVLSYIFHSQKALPLTLRIIHYVLISEYEHRNLRHTERSHCNEIV